MKADINVDVESRIVTVRGQKVILDVDLAGLYDVTTKRLNEQVKRNAERFPEDFAFQLSVAEWRNLKSHFATSSLETSDGKGDTDSARQSASHGGRRTPPWAFTEHGAIMAASVLSSQEAVAMSVYVVRAFVRMRQQITANAHILKRLAEIDRTLLEHDTSLRFIWSKLEPLLMPPAVPPKRSIGFDPKTR